MYETGLAWTALWVAVTLVLSGCGFRIQPETGEEASEAFSGLAQTADPGLFALLGDGTYDAYSAPQKLGYALRLSHSVYAHEGAPEPEYDSGLGDMLAELRELSPADALMMEDMMEDQAMLLMDSADSWARLRVFFDGDDD